MKRVSLALAALALMSGIAAAQDNTSQRTSPDSEMGRDSQRGAVKTSDIDSQTGRDMAVDRDMAANRDLNEDAKGTGVATGFVAAGIGLALLGLFVRRRNRRYGHYDDDATRGGRTPPRV